jgi:aromatic-L-amino-acid decarboxylase
VVAGDPAESAAHVVDGPLDAVNQRLLSSLNATGKLFLTHTRLRGRFCLRLSIGGTWTAERHVRDAWAAIRGAAASLGEVSR